MNKDGFKRMVDNAMRSYGEVDYGKRVIRINKKKSKKTGKGELLDSIVHEEQHVKHPRMKEKGIKRLTEKLTKRMPSKVKRRHYARYNKKKYG